MAKNRVPLLSLPAAIAAVLLLLAAPARAAVTITFYSHKFHMFHGVTTEFPHGFAILSGTDSAGQPVNVDLGFSATTMYALALIKPIDGALDDPYTPDYVAEATPQFSFTLSDAQYRAVLAEADTWRNWRQPSYDFYDHNCVTFIRDIAVAAGLEVSYARKFIHAPEEFLVDVGERNRPFLDQDGHILNAAILAAPAQSPAPGTVQQAAAP